MWPTKSEDPAYQLWSEQLQDEFKIQGIPVNTDFYYAHQGEDSTKIALRRLKSRIHTLSKQGKKPDLVLAKGDYLCRLLNESHKVLPEGTLAICYGLSRQSIHHPSSFILNSTVRIQDSLYVKENLDFANFVLNIHPQQDSQGYWIGKQPRHRFCSLLDPVFCEEDAYKFQFINKILGNLDSTQYFNNFYNITEEDSLIQKAADGIIIYSCRSIKHPTFNSPLPLKRQISSKWAFYPQMSPNCFLQVKHDAVSRGCVENLNFFPYFTMEAEDYLTNDSCIGGYIAPFDLQRKEVVAVAKQLFMGVTPEHIGTQHHQHQYCINWNVLRNKGLTLTMFPDSIRIDNVQYKDRNPESYRQLITMLDAIVPILVIAALIITYRAIRRRRFNIRLYRQKAMEAIQNNQLLEYTLKATGSVSWNDQEADYSLLKRMKLNEFYQEKLADFLKQANDGRYSMQLQGSVDEQPVHWYELLMYVTHEDGMLKRQGILTKIDAQKEQESKFLEAHRLMLNTKTREGFVAAMGHEIRTPLNAIVGYAQVLSAPGAECSPEQLQEYGLVIDSNVAVLKKMINDLLLVTLMNNSTLSAQCTDCMTADLMQTKNWPDAMAYLERRKNNLRIESQVADTSVKVDARLFHAIIENLLINASKFSDVGSTISMGWGLPAYNEKTEELEIWIQDEGMGIGPEHQSLIFDRFYKIDSYVPGCGLGLYICKTYVELMGGTISVESQYGKGATFRIRLKR